MHLPSVQLACWESMYRLGPGQVTEPVPLSAPVPAPAARPLAASLATLLVPPLRAPAPLLTTAPLSLPELAPRVRPPHAATATSPSVRSDRRRGVRASASCTGP